MRNVVSVIASCLVSCLLCACPPEGSGAGAKKSQEPVTTCERVGQSCTYREGKLGLCVEGTAICEGKPCIVCQSQH